MTTGIKYLDHLRDGLKEINSQKTTLFVGWEDEFLSLLARTHEYGTHNAGKNHNITIPPRPHRQQTKDKNKDKWIKVLTQLLETNNYDVAYSFKQLGDIMSMDWRDIIKNANFTPLAKSTIKARIRTQNQKPNAKNPKPVIYGDAPLNATGDLLRGIDYKVTNE